MSDVAVVDDQENSEYIITVGGKKAGEISYHISDGIRVMPHTGIAEAFQGQGLAGKLAQGALALAKEEGQPILPLCPYLRSYIAKHQEWLDIVEPDYRAVVTSSEGK